MSQHGKNHSPFRDVRPEDLRMPDLNPYVRTYQDFGPPVILGGDAPDFKGDWGRAFGRPGPLHVEIGPGNGFYLAGMAARHPDRNWLGIEIRFKRVVLCARKIVKAGMGESARVTRYDAWWLDDIFAAGDIQGLVTNFSDPWMKDSQSKKRLMSEPFATWVAKALSPGGTWRIKTDHKPNVDRVVAAVTEGGLPFDINGRSEDVAGTGAPWDPEDDVITNYQSKFIKKGLPTHALLLTRRSD